MFYFILIYVYFFCFTRQLFVLFDKDDEDWILVVIDNIFDWLVMATLIYAFRPTDNFRLFKVRNMQIFYIFLILCVFFCSANSLSSLLFLQDLHIADGDEAAVSRAPPPLAAADNHRLGTESAAANDNHQNSNAPTQTETW